MSTENAEKILSGRDIKPTPNRIMVLKELIDSPYPVSLTDLEISLDTVDKASIFRVLELFAAKEIVHVIEDGSRSLKYELCHNSSHHSIADQHVHFFCEQCKRTYCFEDTDIPMIEIPEGFVLRGINYMIKGLCPECGKKVTL